MARGAGDDRVSLVDVEKCRYLDLQTCHSGCRVRHHVVDCFPSKLETVCHG